MPKNVQTIIQSCSFHMLARICSKSYKLVFSSTWTENFQMHKLRFKESEEPEIKLPTFLGIWIKQGNSRITSTSVSLIMLKSDCVCHNKLWKILWKKEVGIPDHHSCLLRNLYACQEAAVRTVHGTIDWFQIVKGVGQGCILSPCLFNFCAEYIMWNAGLDESSWIQDFWESAPMVS